MTGAETAWLAGLLEGEGSFDPRRGVRLKMTDRDVVARAASVVGLPPERVREDAWFARNGHTRQYVICVSGALGRQVMRDLLPYMGTRRSARIRECLDICEKKGLT